MSIYNFYYIIQKMILIILRIFKTVINACNDFLELMDFKTRRVAAFKKNLIELTELEIKHAKVSAMLLFFELYLNFPAYQECIYIVFAVARGIAQEVFICTSGRVILF